MVVVLKTHCMRQPLQDAARPPELVLSKSVAQAFDLTGILNHD